MGARVQRESSVQPLVCEVPQEPEVARPQTVKVGQATADDVERFRATENDARAGVMGTALEQGFRTALGGVPDGARSELEVAASGTGKAITGNARGKIGVERRGHEYLVTLDASAGAGLKKKEGDLSGTVTANVEGKATLRYGSLEEAADGLAAMVQTGAMAGGGLVGAAALLLKDPDAVPRTLHAVDRLDSIELSAGDVAELKLELPGPTGFKGTLVGKATVTPASVKLDLKKGEVIFTSRESLGVDGSVGAELVPKTLSMKVPQGEFKGKGEVALHASYPLSREDLARIAREPRELLKLVSDPSRHLKWTADFTASGQVQGVELVARRSGSPQEMLGAFLKGTLLQGSDFHVEGFQVQSGVSVKADAGVASVSLTQKTSRKVLDGRGELAPLVGEAVAKARQNTAQERELEARRALPQLQR